MDYFYSEAEIKGRFNILTFFSVASAHLLFQSFQSKYQFDIMPGAANLLQISPHESNEGRFQNSDFGPGAPYIESIWKKPQNF